MVAARRVEDPPFTLSEYNAPVFDSGLVEAPRRSRIENRELWLPRREKQEKRNQMDSKSMLRSKGVKPVK